MNYLTLSQMTDMIRSVLSSSLSNTYWVKAEIAKLNYQYQTNRCFPELVEKSDNTIKAKINGVIWENDYLRISKLFTEVARQSLKDGLEVLFEAKVRYSPVYGLQLQIIDIDPVFTLGALAVEKQKSIDKLRSEGLFNRNKETEMPLIPKSLAVISAETGKGFNDFVSIINMFSDKYRIFYKLFRAALQGDSAVSSITHQLSVIKNNIEQYDAVLIIRGGGDELDLNCYNNYQLAKEVAMFPIPVITGIGHSTNDTVVEMVAFHSNITPTDVAYFILGYFVTFEERINNARLKLIGFTERILVENKHRINEMIRMTKTYAMPSIKESSSYLNNLNTNLSKNVNKHLINNNQKLAGYNIRLRSSKIVHISKAYSELGNLKNILVHKCNTAVSLSKNRLQFLDDKVNMMDPVNVLRRGFSITRQNGKVLKDVANLSLNEIISTELSSGIVKSKIEKISKNKDGK